ncbi:hypothetical protein GCM10009020_33360 [Natronoarchaeum mannanilyticum]|uniref:Uncharacterized protein n=1 Tax=Natronoarchaeum mannanilyticum TaxID=926360 RepID=A0AAV3TDV9_9EURY
MAPIEQFVRDAATDTTARTQEKYIHRIATVPSGPSNTFGRLSVLPLYFLAFVEMSCFPRSPDAHLFHHE